MEENNRENLRRGISESGEGIWIVRLDSNYYPLVQENLDPDSESDHEGHS